MACYIFYLQLGWITRLYLIYNCEHYTTKMEPLTNVSLCCMKPVPISWQPLWLNALLLSLLLVIQTCSTCFSSFFSSFRWISLNRSTCLLSGDAKSALLFRSASILFKTGSSSSSLPIAWSSAIPSNKARLFYRKICTFLFWEILRIKLLVQTIKRYLIKLEGEFISKLLTKAKLKWFQWPAK